MDTQEILALSVVAVTAALFAWRWWQRRRSGRGLPCSHCCGGGSGGRPASLHLRASKGNPVSIGLTPPAP